MGNTPADKNIEAAKERLINVKPGEPGFIRPRVPSDPDFVAFLKEQGFYPRFSRDTKRRLHQHLELLDTPHDIRGEIDALERQAAITQYRFVYSAKPRPSVAQREKVACNFLDAVENFKTELDALIFNGIIDDPNSVEVFLEDSGEVHVVRSSIRDLQAALDDSLLQVAAAVTPGPPIKSGDTDRDKFGNAENVHRSRYIRMCIQVWLRNGGSNELTLRLKHRPTADKRNSGEFETGLWPFVSDATRDTFTGGYLGPITRDILSKHRTAVLERLHQFRQFPQEDLYPDDPAVEAWSTNAKDEKPDIEMGSLRDIMATAALHRGALFLRKALNNLHKLCKSCGQNAQPASNGQADADDKKE
jgi:hypothetical protein